MSPEAFEKALSAVRLGKYIELIESECNEKELEELANLRNQSGATIHVVLNESSLLIKKLRSLGAYVTPDKSEAVLT